MGVAVTSVVAVAWLGAGFPWGTLAVNAIGSLAIGALAGADVEGGARLLLVTGVLGGFTTFSAFSLDALTLWERGQASLAAAYVAGSVILSLAGIFAGVVAARGIFA